MKILITGVHGFVGSNLVEALKKEHTIYGLDIISPQKDGVRSTFGWDYLDKVDGIPEVDAIIHLAGKAHDTKNKSAADVYFKVNTDLTKKIFNWFLAQPKCKRFVFFSTAKAAADRVDGVLTEDVVPSPVGPYGESKIEAERYLQSRMDEISRQARDDKGGARDNKKTYILRPCMIHGPGNKGNLNLLYGVVKKGIPWPLGAFENKRTFTSIDNLCYIIEGLLNKDVESGIYNINDDEAVSTNELIEIICSAMGKQAIIWRIPRGLMKCMTKIGDVLHLPLNSERLQKLTENYISSNAKIKKALGIEKLPVRAKDGLTKTIKSFNA